MPDSPTDRQSPFAVRERPPRWRTALTSLMRIALVAGAVGVILGLLGPFGTYESLPVGQRLGYWTMLLLIGVACYPGVYWGARWLGIDQRTPIWIWLPAAAAIGTIPMTAQVIGLTHVVFGQTFSTYALVYLNVFCIGLPMLVLMHVLEGRLFPQTKETASPQGAIADIVSTPAVIAQPEATPDALDRLARFKARLPAHLRAELLALRMEDHYLRVYTSAGDDLVLMRMKDAVAFLGDENGVQVHRSWWVAKAAVAAARRDGKGAVLTLTNGIEAPVARERMPAAKAAGIL